MDWLQRRLTVYAAKTDSERLVPIFPVLYHLLRDACELAPAGSTRVVTVSKYNRHRRFRQILRRAGISVWPDLFQTLRRSCESHMASMGLPQHAVSAWIGIPWLSPRNTIYRCLQSYSTEQQAQQ